MSDLAQRYGTTPRPVRRRLATGVVTVVVLVALGWLVWAMLFHGRPMARSELVSFDVKDEHTAVATVTVVRRSQEVEASCLLRAYATDHSIVGELSFAVGPSEPRTATSTLTVRTEREATSVELMGCLADGQQQRR